MAVISSLSAEHAAPASGAKHLSWALCVSTINRPDIIELCCAAALNQTRKPDEIVVCDASDDWQASRARVAARASAAGVPLIYLAAAEKSLTVQRNQAIAAAGADILMLFDDDVLMHPTCAEELMRIYEADRDGAVAALGASRVETPPDRAPRPAQDAGAEDAGADPGDAGALGARKNSGLRDHGQRFRRFRRSRVWRFINREILLMSADRMLVPYDSDRRTIRPPIPTGLERFALWPVRHISGYSLSVRRNIALAEPFEADLRSYCPAEDLDATYRFGRHGGLYTVRSAHIYHHEAAPGRIRRFKATLLGVLNSAYFLRRHSDPLLQRLFPYYLLMLRRFVAEIIKDLLTGRFTLPQARGAAEGIVRSVRVFSHPANGLSEWYIGLQKRILSR